MPEPGLLTKESPTDDTLPTPGRAKRTPQPAEFNSCEHNLPLKIGVLAAKWKSPLQCSDFLDPLPEEASAQIYQTSQGNLLSVNIFQYQCCLPSFDDQVKLITPGNVWSRRESVRAYFDLVFVLFDLFHIFAFFRFTICRVVTEFLSVLNPVGHRGSSSDDTRNISVRATTSKLDTFPDKFAQSGNHQRGSRN